MARTHRVPERESARDRLLTAASQLFHDVGVQAAGVDALIAAAGVAKATFYRHFPSEDDLVVAWLRDPRTRWFERIRAQAEERSTTPDDRIPRLFEAVADWLDEGNYRGCPYLNSSVEITDATHPARQVITDYLQEIEDHLTGLAADAGHRDPRRFGAELQTLLAGSIALGVARRIGSPALLARDVALTMLTGAPPA